MVVGQRDLGGLTIEDYANRLARAWGIGGADTDRGVLFLVAVDDRQVRIENGYGVEGYLPDGLTGTLLRQQVLPHFRDNDYSTGILNGNLQLAALTAAEFGFELSGAPAVAPLRRSPRSGERQPRGLLANLFALVIFILFIGFAIRNPWMALFLFAAMRGGGRGFGGGGGFGGGSFGGFGGGSFGGGGASGSW